MSGAADPERPSLGVVIAGGFGVVAVVAFVVALLFGATSDPRPGDRVEAARVDGRMVVVAGRCSSQRVTSVSLAARDGRTLWRITSTKGSIERRYPVGEAPFGFTTATPLTSPPSGPVLVEVGFDREGEASTDHRAVDAGALRSTLPRLDEAAPACGARHLRPGAITAILFAVGAAAVVVGYGGMVLRYTRGDR